MKRVDEALREMCFVVMRRIREMNREHLVRNERRFFNELL